MAITERTLTLEQELRDSLRGVTDAQVRDLTRAFATAWDEIEPDLHAALLEQLVSGDRVTRAQLLRSVRLRKALIVIADKLEALAAEAGVRITGDLRDIIDTAGSAQASVIDSQLPADFMTADDLATWSRVDERQIEAIVKRSTEQITSLTKTIPAEQMALVRRELIRGVAAGTNPKATAARIVRRTEGRFNGGLNRALVIARTETLDAHRAAARLGRLEHADVLAGWTWTSALDTRTCPSCWFQHGTVHPADVFGPDDHQQGRCAAVPTTKSWADLGIDVEEPPSLLPDPAAKFDGLDEETQRGILGPKRYDAWKSGDYPMEAWSQKRITDGWRDSYGVSPVPQSSNSGGRASRSAA